MVQDIPPPPADLHYKAIYR